MLRPISRRVCGIFLLLTAILIFYLAFLTQTYYWDGVLFSIQIESVHVRETPAIVLFHPNHLLYSALGYVLYNTALWAGLHIRAITVLQVVNVFASVAAAWVVYLLSSRITRSQPIALFSSLLFASGATWWKFSTDADSYILCVLLLLLAGFFLIDDQPRIIAAGLCHVGAMLFHELAIFLYGPVVLTIIFDKRRSKAEGLWVSVAYALASGLCVAAAYALCYAYADHRAYPSLLRWIASYDAANSKFTHSFRAFVPYLSGYLKLFLGGRLTLIRKYFSATEALAFCISAAALVFAIWKWRQQNAQAPRVDHRTVWFLWSWFAVYAAFLAMWDSGSTFHKLFLWPAIVLLIGVYIADRPQLRARAGAFLAIAGAIAAWNFGAFIYPHSRADADPVLGLAKKIDRELPRNATVFYAAPNADSWFIQYFAPGRRWILLPRDKDASLEVLKRANGPVCLDTTALNEFGPQLQTERKWDLVDSHHDVRFECLATPTRPDSAHPAHFLR